MQKALAVVFVGLFLVLLIEGYIFWTMKPKELLQVSKTQPSPAQSITITEATLCVTPTPLPYRAIDDKNIRTLEVLHSGVVYSSIVTHELRGKISELNSDPAYAFVVRIIGKNDQTNAFKFLKYELAKLQFYQTTQDGKQQPIKKDDLHIGDTITMTLTDDLTKPGTSNFIAGTITKLKQP